jgi:hypothetical protein
MLSSIASKKGLAGLAPMGRDRRVLPRYPFTAAAEALDPHARSRMTARTSDISRGGCYVDTFCPFPRNAHVKIRILRKDEHVVADAKVAYSTIGMGMGLCFTAVQPEHQRVLDKWIGELSGETPVTFDAETRGEIGEGSAPATVKKAQNSPPQTTDLEFEAREAITAANNDPALVLHELIIALIRRGALEANEGHALLLKLVKPAN